MQFMWYCFMSCIYASIDLKKCLDEEYQIQHQMGLLLQRKYQLLSHNATTASPRSSSLQQHVNSSFVSSLEHVLLHRTRFSDQYIVHFQLITWMISSKGRRNTSPSISLLVAGTSHGKITFYIPLTSEILYSIHIIHESPLLSFHCTDARIVLHRANGDFQILSLNVFENRKRIVGKTIRWRNNGIIQKVIKKSVYVVDKPMGEYMNHYEKKKTDIIFPWTSIPIYRSPVKGWFFDIQYDVLIPSQNKKQDQIFVLLLKYQNRYFILEGIKDQGHLQIYNTYNQSTIASIPLYHPITAMAPISNKVIAIATGSSLSFLSISTFTLLDGSCRIPSLGKDRISHESSVHRNSDIVHVVPDATRATYFYASTRDGTSWLLTRVNTRQHSQEANTGTVSLPSCKILQRLQSRMKDTTSLTNSYGIGSFKGYALMATSASSLVLYNASQLSSGKSSASSVKYVYEMEASTLNGSSFHYLETSHGNPNHALVMILHFNTSLNSTQLVADIYESLLSYDESIFDISWIRTPLLIIGFFGIVMWQTYKKKKKGAESSDEFSNWANGFNQWEQSQGREGLPSNVMQDIGSQSNSAFT